MKTLSAIIISKTISLTMFGSVNIVAPKKITIYNTIEEKLRTIDPGILSMHP